MVSYGKEKGQEQNTAFRQSGRPQRDAKREEFEAVYHTIYVYIICMELLTLLRGNIFMVIRTTDGVEKIGGYMGFEPIVGSDYILQ